MINPRRSSIKLDAVLLILLLGIISFVAYRITVGLNYNWNWAVIPQFIFRYDKESGQWVSNYLFHGLMTTIRLSLWSGIFALIIGIFMAMTRTGKSLFWRMVSRCYVELMRNIPPLVLIFIFYFFLASQLTVMLGMDDIIRESSERTKSIINLLFCRPEQFTAFTAAVITLSVFAGAYMTEILRAGIQGVEQQQWEASYALGMNRRHTMQLIILPQAVRQVLPPLAGQFISLIKDSAIVSIISIQELSYQGTQLMASTYLTIEVWITIALMYLMLTMPASMGVSWLEKNVRKKW